MFWIPSSKLLHTKIPLICTANRSQKIQELYILCSGYGLESLKKAQKMGGAQSEAAQNFELILKLELKI